MKERNRPVEALLSLKGVPEVHVFEANGTLVFGAALTISQITSHKSVCQHYGALADGAMVIGSVQIRNMATVGGNICNASPSADTAPGLLVLGAQAVLASQSGQRIISLDEFFLGPGKTVLKPGELLKEIRIPRPAGRSGSAYLRHTPRVSMDLAFVGVAAALTLDPAGRMVSVRIALGAVAPTPIRAIQAEALLTNKLPDAALFDEASQIAARESKPIDDLRASSDYRRHLVSVMTRRVLSMALARTEEMYAS